MDVKNSHIVDIVQRKFGTMSANKQHNLSLVLPSWLLSAQIVFSILQMPNRPKCERYVSDALNRKVNTTTITKAHLKLIIANKNLKIVSSAYDML